MARIKYFNKATGNWEYADSQFVAGSGSGGGYNSWKKLFETQLTEPVSQVIISAPEEYNEIFAYIRVDFANDPIVDADGNGVANVGVDAGFVSNYGFAAMPLIKNAVMNKWVGAWGWLMQSPTHNLSESPISGTTDGPWITLSGLRGSGAIDTVNALFPNSNLFAYKAKEIIFTPRQGQYFNKGLRFYVWYR